MANCSKRLKNLIAEYWQAHEEASDAQNMFNLAPSMKHRIRRAAAIDKILIIEQNIEKEVEHDDLLIMRMQRIIQAIQEFTSDSDLNT